MIELGIDDNTLYGKELVKSLENTPSPMTFEYYRTLESREIWIDNEICEEMDTINVVKRIYDYNREDKLNNIKPKDRKPIILYLFTNGGDLDMCYSIIDSINVSETPVYTVAVGRVFSAGAYIFLSGKKRFMLKNAQLLFHQGSGGMEGQYDIVQSMATQYATRVGGLQKLLKKFTKYDKKYIEKKIKNEWYVGSKEALENGACDKIIESIDEIIF